MCSHVFPSRMVVTLYRGRGVCVIARSEKSMLQFPLDMGPTVVSICVPAVLLLVLCMCPCVSVSLSHSPMACVAPKDYEM
jgi:hypothetical protein